MPETGADYHPRAGEVVDSSEMSEHLSEGYPFEDRFVSGLNLTWDALTAHIAPGAANIGGKYVTLGSQVDELLSPSTTNYIFLNSTADVRVDTTPTPGADEILLWTAVTSGVTVTGSTTNLLPALVVNEDLEVIGNVAADGELSGSSIAASSTQPYLELIDESGGGESYRVWNRNGKLQLTDPSGAAVYVDDISTLAGEFQKPVKDILDFTTSEPVGPTTGDRYINTVTGSSSATAQSLTANDIVEWDGSTWLEFTPTEGWATWVNDVDQIHGFTGAVWSALSATSGNFRLLNAPLLRTASFTATQSKPIYHIQNSTPATQTIATLPETPSDGDEIEFIADNNSGGVRVKENATGTHPIVIGDDAVETSTASTGAGYIQTLSVLSRMRLRFHDSKWQVISGIGSWVTDTGDPVPIGGGQGAKGYSSRFLLMGA